MFLLLIFILTQTKHTPPTTEKVVPQMFRNNSAKQGKKVKLLPIVLEEFGQKIRNKILPNAKTGKNPDLLVDGKYVEVKEISNPKRRNINERITSAKNQADIIVLLMPKKEQHKWDKYIKRRAEELNVTTIVLPQ